MSNDLKELSALTALNDMMEKGRFDICCVRDVGKLLGRDAEGHESFAILRPLHMVSFSKMPAKLRDAVPSLVQDCLGVSPSYRFATLQPQIIDVTPQPKGGFLRLLGMKP